jgi:hypothetical protein
VFSENALSNAPYVCHRYVKIRAIASPSQRTSTIGAHDFRHTVAGMPRRNVTANTLVAILIILRTTSSSNHQRLKLNWRAEPARFQSPSSDLRRASALTGATPTWIMRCIA